MSRAKQIARSRVANGVKLLDERVPGWWRVINLDRLQMEDCTQCMLGQLFGHNVETALGAKMFGLEIEPQLASVGFGHFFQNSIADKAGYQRGLEALETGGSTIGCNNNNIDNIEYSDLKCAWAEVIAERRAAEAVAAVEAEGEEQTTV